MAAFPRFKGIIAERGVTSSIVRLRRDERMRGGRRLLFFGKSQFVLE